MMCYTVTSQQRAAASEAGLGQQQQQQQQQGGTDEEGIEQVAEIVRRASNHSSPVRPSHLPNQGGDDDEEQVEDDVPARTTRAGSKRKREDSGGRSRTGSNVVGGSRNTPVRNTPVRAHVESMIDAVRAHLLGLLEDADDVSLWISILNPKIDDGNNFGVEVQSLAHSYVSEATVRERILLLLLLLSTSTMSVGVGRIFESVCLSVFSSITQKRMTPKCSNLVKGILVGYPRSGTVLRVQRSKVKVTGSMVLHNNISFLTTIAFFTFARWRYQYYNVTTALRCHSLLTRWRH